MLEMGYLSNGEVVVVGASQLTGAFVGSSAKATNELLDSVAGKVLVIDEAYVLGTTSFGKEALDVLVERVQGTPGEDFAVILCGYNDPMRKMLKDCNPGLARRFKIDDAFLFEDYSDAELEKILQQKASEAGMLVSPEIAQSVVKKVIAKQRIKPNFGNAGAVANLLDRGKQRLMGRGDRQKRDNQWVILEEDLRDMRKAPIAPDSVAWKKLHGMLGLAAVKKSIENLVTMAAENIKSEEAGDEVLEISLHRIFLGNPGTGTSINFITSMSIYTNSTSEVLYIASFDVIVTLTDNNYNYACIH